MTQLRVGFLSREISFVAKLKHMQVSIWIWNWNTSIRCVHMGHIWSRL